MVLNLSLSHTAFCVIALGKSYEYEAREAWKEKEYGT